MTSTKRSKQDGTADDGSIRFIMATDLHVGYGERDGIRKDDSFNALEEVLRIAKERSVDFVLCGGDLFHDNKPSRECYYRVTQLLRKYCLSDRPVNVQFNSDAALIFDHSEFPWANYEDPNLNVGMPFFTIHGNHDDLSGAAGLTALDPLHEAGLLNLFGKFASNDKLEVRPVLLSKGGTRVALYGIGSQRDDRLARAFAKEEVRFMSPTQHHDEWFNVLILHQNRPIRSTTRSTGAHIDEKLLPKFAHMVLWGHEHECRIEPEHVCDDDTNPTVIIQPGSTVATSLSREEAGDKKIGLITVRRGHRGRYDLEQITLQSTRPYIWDEVVLDAEDIALPLNLQTRGLEEQDELFCRARVTELIAQAARDRRPGQPALPLIRLRVVYSGKWAKIPNINITRFGAHFTQEVANYRDILLVQRRNARRSTADGGVEVQLMSDIARQQRQDVQTTVEDIVSKYFSCVDNPHKQLAVFNEDYLCDVLKEYVMKDDHGCIAKAVDRCCVEMKREKDEPNVTAKDIDTTLDAMREHRHDIRQRRRDAQEKQAAEHAALHPTVDDDDIVPKRSQKPAKATPAPAAVASTRPVDVAMDTRPSDTQEINDMLGLDEPNMRAAMKEINRTTQQKRGTLHSFMGADAGGSKRTTRAGSRQPGTNDVSIVGDTMRNKTAAPKSTTGAIKATGADLFDDLIDSD